MKQLLLKARETIAWLFGVIALLTRELVAFLRSVNIDQPRGVVLCIALQLIVVISMLLAFRGAAAGPARPLAGDLTSEVPAQPAESGR